MSLVPYVGTVVPWYQRARDSLIDYATASAGDYFKSYLGTQARRAGRAVGRYIRNKGVEAARKAAQSIRSSWSSSNSLLGQGRRNRIPRFKSSTRSYTMPKRKIDSIGTFARQGISQRMRMAIARRNRAPRGRFVKGAIAPYGGRRELKFVDTALSALALDTTGTVTALNLIAVGDDNTSRDGRQVTIKSCQIKAFATPPDLTTTGPNKSRVLLVWDNAVNSGTIAAITDILVTANANAFPLINNANRFTILWDSNWEFNVFDQTATQAAVDSGSKSIEYYTRINKVTQYSGTTAAIGSIQNGGLLLVTVGTTTAANAQVLNGNVRVRFTDD